MGAQGVFLLHAGTHKTGTTSMQAAFAMSEGILAASGVLYPKSGRIGAGHHNLPWGLLGDERFDPAAGYLDDLAVEVRQGGFRNVLVSSEDFEYLRTRTAELTYLRDLIESWGYEPRVVFAFREPAEYAESLYAELIKHDLTEERQSFVSDALDQGGVIFKSHWDFRLDYSQLIEGFAQVFGRDAITSLAYDPQDMVTTFAGQFRSFLGDAADRLSTDLRENETKGRRGD
jgi:hypothetical protein